MSLGDSYQYLIAWLIYILASVGVCVFWWKVTSFLRKRVWRDLARGIVLVLVVTPWYVGESAEHYAPAVVVLLMDLLLEGTKNGMRGGFALLISTFLMLLVLSVRQFFFTLPRKL